MLRYIPYLRDIGVFVGRGEEQGRRWGCAGGGLRSLKKGLNRPRRSLFPQTLPLSKPKSQGCEQLVTLSFSIPA